MELRSDEIKRSVRQQVINSIDYTKDISDEEMYELIDNELIQRTKSLLMSVEDRKRLRTQIFHSIRKLDVLQQLLQTRAVHVQAGEAIVLVYLDNVPALSFADGCQKLPLVADAGALSLEIVILGEPAIDANSKQPRRGSEGDLVSTRSVHHGDSPHNPDKP